MLFKIILVHRFYYLHLYICFVCMKCNALLECGTYKVHCYIGSINVRGTKSLWIGSMLVYFVLSWLFAQWTVLHSCGGWIHEGVGVSSCRSWMCAVGGGRGSYGGCVLRNAVFFLRLRQSGWSLGWRQSRWSPFPLSQKGSGCWNRWSFYKQGWSSSRLHTHVWSLSTLLLCRGAISWS